MNDLIISYRKLRHNRLLFAGIILLALLIAPVVVVLVYQPYSPTAIDIARRFQLPSWQHWLGTDNLGRDIAVRIFFGARFSLLISFLSLIIGGSIGIALGAFSGYYQGKIDTFISKFTEVQMAFPGVLLALMLLAVFGIGTLNTVVALSLMAIPRFTRISRSGFFKYRGSEFVRSAMVRGLSDWRIIWWHILPNLRYELLVTFSLTLATTIMSEAGLSYIGLGLQPPLPSMGRMLSDAQQNIFAAPHYILSVSGYLSLMIIGFTLLGEGLQQVNKYE